MKKKSKNGELTKAVVIKQAYISKYNSKTENQVILLMITDSQK